MTTCNFNFSCYSMQYHEGSISKTVNKEKEKMKTNSVKQLVVAMVLTCILLGFSAVVQSECGRIQKGDSITKISWTIVSPIWFPFNLLITPS